MSPPLDVFKKFQSLVEGEGEGEGEVEERELEKVE